jgi:hypothetical protein
MADGGVVPGACRPVQKNSSGLIEVLVKVKSLCSIIHAPNQNETLRNVPIVNDMATPGTTATYNPGVSNVL